jgi:hypothetical protein
MDGNFLKTEKLVNYLSPTESSSKKDKNFDSPKKNQTENSKKVTIEKAPPNVPKPKTPLPSPSSSSSSSSSSSFSLSPVRKQPSQHPRESPSLEMLNRSTNSPEIKSKDREKEKSPSPKKQSSKKTK